MAVTLRDVALHAGVSTRTVSNVVNGFPHISPPMRAKVQAALNELNYKPNLLARSLRQGRTGIITLLLPEIAVPYFGELAHEVVERASELGYTVMIDETGGKPDRERALLDVAAESSWVDGVLLSSQGLHGRDLAGLAPSMPVVLLGERTARTALDHVGIDNVKAARDAVRHLIGSGRRRIAAIGGNASASDAPSRLRFKGYQQEMRAAGLPTEGLYVRTPDYSRASAVVATRSLLDRDDRPDGLFCFSDALAAGVLRELYEQGLRVPADISVVGFDDVEEARFATPSLTSIRPDKAKIANVALDMLIQRMQGSEVKPRDVRVGYELIVRESSSPVGRTSGPSMITKTSTPFLGV
ncbi:MAG: LacI family transcriptional regulator [Actinomycetota bacterium]|nr:LacI family transcriptional regulator [Actinomycetota bacterium]